MRQINHRGLSLIKAFEGLRLKAYLCPAGVPTIGYGSTGKHVKMGMEITEAEADLLLKRDLKRFELGVAELTQEDTTTGDQFSAMVSLAFNIGLSAFARSTVLKRHNNGNPLGASRAFAMWNRGGGRVLPGLVRRREAEAALYRGEHA
jgi:lysozyme